MKKAKKPKPVNKTIIYILAVIFILSASGLAYLNKVVLPRKTKAIIIKAIENQTHKSVSLGSVRINIFKGLVLEDLDIYDGEETLIKIKEVSCVFWFWGLIQKKIIIPSINLKSAEIFLEKREDKTFNLADLFLPKAKDSSSKQGQDSPPQDKGKDNSSRGFNFEIYRVNLVDSSLHFTDKSLNEPFSQDFNDVDVYVYLSLPASLKFKASAKISGSVKPSIILTGEFKIPREELLANMKFNSISPGKFGAYYEASGIGIKSGVVDASVLLKMKDNLLSFNCKLKSTGLKAVKENMVFDLNVEADASLEYKLSGGEIRYSGEAIFVDSAISGLQILDSINKLNAQVSFNNSGIFSDHITADIWEIPVSAKFKLNDFSNPIINSDISSNVDLSKAQELLKEEFDFVLPGSINGNGNLLLNISTNKFKKGVLDLNGYFDIMNANIKLDKINDPIQDIRGRLDFTSDRLQADELNFKYQGIPYKFSILLDNFNSPDVSIGLISEDFRLKSDFSVEKSNVNIDFISGSYIDSDFNILGSLSLSDLNADLSGELNIKLDNLNKLLAKSMEKINQISPKGDLQVIFTLVGGINNLKRCTIKAKAQSQEASLYGLKGINFSCDYNQQAEIIDIPYLTFDFYGGTVNASAKANLGSENLPYSFNLAMRGIKIEELKLDTPVKDKNIAGILDGEVKANGLNSDLTKLLGTGKLSIKKGKLWELNIFKGLGKLLFTKDFAQIVFHEGSCSFSIQDNYAITRDLMLKSNMAYLYGLVKLGFNSSIEAALNIDIINELIPLSGTFKDVTTAVVGKAGKFATIEISGTLSEPKYKFKTAVGNLIKGLANIINENIFKK